MRPGFAASQQNQLTLISAVFVVYATKRRLVFLAAAVILVVVGRLFSRGGGGPLGGLFGAPGSPRNPSSESKDLTTDTGPAKAPSTRLRRPPASSVTLGVLTDRPEADVIAVIDRARLAEGIASPLCGDASACDAVRSTLLDEHATTLSSGSLSDWAFGGLVLDAGVAGLPVEERGRAARVSRVVSIRVSTATSPRQLAVRAAFAAAAEVAEKLGGWVQDPLLARLETARAFAAHAVTVPLDASAFRRDRVEILVEPLGEGVVRLLSAGLSRWGAPDVEASRVPRGARDRVIEIVLAVAAAVADGEEVGPCVLSRDDVARVRGEAYPSEAELPPLAHIPIDLVSVRGAAGDDADFVARISPSGGDGPMGYLDLAERFFGSLLDSAPEAPDARGRDETQRQLDAALARWSSDSGPRARLLVRFPFVIPGDAGVESMWVDVARFDAWTVGGVLLDDPLAATDVARGDSVARPRAQVETLRWADGAP